LLHIWRWGRHWRASEEVEQEEKAPKISSENTTTVFAFYLSMKTSNRRKTTKKPVKRLPAAGKKRFVFVPGCSASCFSLIFSLSLKQQIPFRDYSWRDQRFVRSFVVCLVCM
jgi:hypothetical protein